MDTRFPRVSLVIPALNEARNLPHVFAQLPREPPRGRAGRRQLVRRHRRGRQVALAEHPDHPSEPSWQGQRAGLRLRRLSRRHHRDAGRGRLHQPSRDPALVDALVAGADFAKGSRFVAGGGGSDLTSLRRPATASLARWSTRSTAPPTPTCATGTTPSGPACLPLLGLDPGRSLDGDEERSSGGRIRGRDAHQHPDRQGGPPGDRGGELRAQPAARREQPQRRSRTGSGCSGPSRSSAGEISSERRRGRSARDRRSSGARSTTGRTSAPPRWSS